MKNIAILIADGFEDLELIGAIDHWKRAGISFEILSIDNQKETKGSFFSRVDSKPLKGVDLNSFDALFIPGGKGKERFDKFDGINSIINDFNNKSKGVFAICAAPDILYKAKILKGKKFTCWPGLNLPESTGNPFEVDGNIITGKDYLSTLEFAQAVVEFIQK